MIVRPESLLGDSAFRYDKEVTFVKSQQYGCLNTGPEQGNQQFECQGGRRDGTGPTPQ